MKKIIVVPTYNEKKNVSELVPKIFEVSPDAHVLIVDDNSPDGTAKEVEKMQDKYANLYLLLRQKKEGLGKAYVHAFKEILKDPSYEVIVTMDADGSHDPKYLEPMLKLLDSADFVIGARYIKGGATEGWELWRRILSRWAGLYCRLITGIPIHDFTGGYNVMKSDFLRKIDLNTLNSSGYAYIIELKNAFYQVGARFAEYPILFRNRKEGESKISGHIVSEGIVAPWRVWFKNLEG